MSILVIFLIAAAVVLAVASIIESRGRSWVAWGVLCLAAIHLLGVL